ncbi:MAG: ParB/RepB/Spo0J family partition protein [Paludibacteraceae bacterium]|nr:ParB/RepB/Spo0J family partition protein [Paludibacteraceae bacterium]MBR2492572.1 ParB/RepB/Spo0J family partition protein [Paludibacteraceae bacterium]MBR3871244.1 ParB/RepB/Spo0J family partition protein [Paludibacteraceae bacterium]
MEKKSALGRGLGALIDIQPTVQTSGSSLIDEVELSKIEANPDQPRTNFNEEALQELAASIAELGVVQPITIREIAPEKYMIIAGERRFRASKLAGLTKIPAYIKRVSDETMMEMALVENIQREDLNAIEIALTYQRLLDEYKFTQEKLSERVGKKRATVANYLRLLKLPAEIQLGLTKKEIDMGHARALINVQDPTKMIKLYEEVVAKGYSVRKVEELVRQLNEEGEAKEKKASDPEIQKAYSQIADRLSSIFGAKVKVDRNEKGKGKISLVFSSDEELENILMVIDSIKN